MQCCGSFVRWILRCDGACKVCGGTGEVHTLRQPGFVRPGPGNTFPAQPSVTPRALGVQPPAPGPPRGFNNAPPIQPRAAGGAPPEQTDGRRDTPVSPPSTSGGDTIRASDTFPAPGERVTPPSVLFGHNSSSLSDTALGLLDSWVVEGRRLNWPVLTITGYASSQYAGNPRNAQRYNNELSNRRAQEVADYLSAEGWPEDRLTAVAGGTTSPVRTADGRENYDLSRRVVIQRGVYSVRPLNPLDPDDAADDEGPDQQSGS